MDGVISPPAARFSSLCISRTVCFVPPICARYGRHVDARKQQ
jgi:hypothetical protein